MREEAHNFFLIRFESGIAFDQVVIRWLLGPDHFGDLGIGNRVHRFIVLPKASLPLLQLLEAQDLGARVN